MNLPKNSDMAPIEQLLSADRWLLETGVITASLENNLILQAYLSSVDVLEVAIDIDLAKKILYYTTVMTDKNAKKYRKFVKQFNKCDKTTSFWGKWRKLRLLTKYNAINLESNLKKHISGYAPFFETIEVKIIEKPTLPRLILWIFKIVGLVK